MGEALSLDAKSDDGKVEFQAVLFISFQKPFSLFPSLFLFPPLATPLPSFTQVGRESGTSRLRRLMLYSGAKYPLLYGRMGMDERKIGAREGKQGKMQGW